MVSLNVKRFVLNVKFGCWNIVENDQKRPFFVDENRHFGAKKWWAKSKTSPSFWKNMAMPPIKHPDAFQNTPGCFWIRGGVFSKTPRSSPKNTLPWIARHPTVDFLTPYHRQKIPQWFIRKYPIFDYQWFMAITSLYCLISCKKYRSVQISRSPC